MDYERTLPEHRDYERGQKQAALASHWKTHLLHRLSTPRWETRSGPLPLLASPAALAQRALLEWGGNSPREMATFAFETRPGSAAKFIGVAVPKNARPSAYLIYFRHTARANDYPGGAKLLSLGIGDYFEGRMQICRQVAASGKNVAVILPIALHSSGEFESNATFITQCLKEIQNNLFDGADGPLLLACNSDGIIKMNAFLKNCPGLLKKVLAIYDFDGSRVIAARSISLMGQKARVIRYDGEGALKPLLHEPVNIFLARTMTMNPARVPLAHERWISHPNYPQARPDEHWLHHYIPTCMLHHGLSMTPGI
ncbi:MAG: hypothetical protein KDK04_05490 [Candidatus Competibacteraceae bacterium]|nr:hypothetical protein [Candidatus Competibacteraceae bacterium]MCB1811163.1 hypothetical protein [Candidatus Competibacteraceae bacterium]